MLLFTLALDPILRWMVDRVLLEGDFLRAYADDLGFALIDIHRTLPRLGRAFGLVGDGIGLVLKLPKCVVIPNAARLLDT